MWKFLQQRGCRMCPPSLFPRTVYHKTPPSLPTLINTSQTGRCQILPTVTLTIQHPAEEGGGGWCHCGARWGPIKAWENYVNLCWVCPFNAIEVQWIEIGGEVIFSACEKKKKGEREGESIVVMLMVLSGDSAIKMSWNLIAKTSARPLFRNPRQEHLLAMQEDFDELCGGENVEILLYVHSRETTSTNTTHK